MENQAPQVASQLTPDWVPVNEFIQNPIGSQFFKSYSSFNWLLRNNRRRLIEGGALMKKGKAWAVSVSRAPSVIESIYREQTLAALDGHRRAA